MKNLMERGSGEAAISRKLKSSCVTDGMLMGAHQEAGHDDIERLKLKLFATAVQGVGCPQATGIVSSVGLGLDRL